MTRARHHPWTHAKSRKTRATPPRSTRATFPCPPGWGWRWSPAWTPGSTPHGRSGCKKATSHVIRNAGGVVSDDAIRSLSISQRLLGTTAIILIHHTDRGMVTFNDDDVKAKIDDVRQSIRRIRSSPYLATSDVRGFVYEAETGRLREVA